MFLILSACWWILCKNNSCCKSFDCETELLQTLVFVSVFAVLAFMHGGKFVFVKVGFPILALTLLAKINISGGHFRIVYYSRKAKPNVEYRILFFFS